MAYLNPEAFDITNADIMEHSVEKVRPSQLKKGDVITFLRTLKCCPFGWNVHDHQTAPSGQYRVVDRRHFRGGYQSFVKVE